LANIEKFVENTVKITIDGSDHLDKYNEQMDVITANLENTSNFIETLNTHLAEIDQVGGLIINITEQLKLLSLNSAVEAARAGEAGKGFVVVSQEMNKLSAATRDSVTQINKLLGNIMSSNAKVSESINNVSESFEISKTIFGSVKESFYTINKNANILNNDMKKVYEESLRINENTKDISTHGGILHNASNEISCITQDVAAVTQEELAENEEINNQAVSLQNMLSSIEILLKRFKTSVTPVKQTSQKRLKLVMLSPLDHPFWRNVRQGALYAQTELKSKNTDVEYFGFEKTDETFNQTLDQKIEENCDGIVIPGFIEGIGTYVEKANKKRIPVMSFNCDLPEGIRRLSYFGPDVKAAGTTAGDLLAKGIDYEGEVAIFKGFENTLINIIRRDAAVEVIAKHKRIKIVSEIIDVINNDLVYVEMKKLLNEFPNLKGVIIICGGAPGAAKAIEDMGRVGKVKLLCFDYDDEIIELIKKGSIYTAMGQDPFGQGHDPLVYLYNYIVADEVPNDITHTRTEVMDSRSVGEM
jgi:methyl-accepting chemotaxis protein/ribose transport system substrate-binding protein